MDHSVHGFSPWSCNSFATKDANSLLLEPPAGYQDAITDFDGDGNGSDDRGGEQESMDLIDDESAAATDDTAEQQQELADPQAHSSGSSVEMATDNSCQSISDCQSTVSPRTLTLFPRDRFYRRLVLPKLQENSSPLQLTRIFSVYRRR